MRNSLPHHQVRQPSCDNRQALLRNCRCRNPLPIGAVVRSRWRFQNRRRPLRCRAPWSISTPCRSPLVAQPAPATLLDSEPLPQQRLRRSGKERSRFSPLKARSILSNSLCCPAVHWCFSAKHGGTTCAISRGSSSTKTSSSSRSSRPVPVVRPLDSRLHSPCNTRATRSSPRFPCPLIERRQQQVRRCLSTLSTVPGSKRHSRWWSLASASH